MQRLYYSDARHPGFAHRGGVRVGHANRCVAGRQQPVSLVAEDEAPAQVHAVAGGTLERDVTVNDLLDLAMPHANGKVHRMWAQRASS